MAKLQNVKTLFFIIGFAQILEIYCIVSLEVQHASHFPIQAWASIDAAKAQLAILGENWSWCTNELKLAGIGTPKISSITLWIKRLTLLMSQLDLSERTWTKLILILIL